jgi:hypothetical protein
MTHEEQIKWMTDRIAHLETQYESAMGMATTLMGKLKPLTEQAVEAEREACWNIIFEYAGRDDITLKDESLLKHLADLIRARGQA